MRDEKRGKNQICPRKGKEIENEVRGTIFRTSLLTFTFRPGWVELLPWAYPTDNMTFPPQRC